jgi:predicted unusual protein kinase regulating ubiquinone biosynthesis (AarF/ABC1/UbiB family)
MLKARYRRILWFFSGVLLHLLWWDIFLPRIGFRSRSQTTRPERLRRIAARYRRLAIELGGVMIKVGQWLSARLDVLPPEITDELSGLQDEVQAEDFEAVRQVIEAEFDQPLEARFEFLDPRPVAAASIGQVHCARLRSEADEIAGEQIQPAVVVKVQRPNIERLVATDLAALRTVSRWVMLYRPIRRHADVPALLREFSQSLSEEIDYLHEGKNAEIFAQNFAGVEDVRVPQVYWAHTTRRVLTLEDVGAIKIIDYAAIDAAGVDRKQVAQRLFDTYLKQIFEHHFFHADPHPGNLFVLPQPGEAGGPTAFKIVFVDFGMAGRITQNVVDGLRELVIAVAQRDAARVVKAYQIMRVLLPDADVELLTRANQRAFERFWGKSTTELLEMGQAEALEFLSEFRSLLFENPFQLPDNMILLGRCLSILNGICTGLDPDFNVWQSVIPWADRLIAEEARGQWKVWLGETVDTLRSVVSLPRRAESLIERLEQGRLEMRSPELSRRFQRVERAVGRLGFAVIFAAFLLSGVQLYLDGSLLPAAGLALAAAITLLLALFR